MNDQELLARRKATLGPTYQNFFEQPLHLVRGSGTKLWDADGRQYIDCYNNVVSVGHCHPHVVDALCKQASTLNTHTRYLHAGDSRTRRNAGRKNARRYRYLHLYLYR